AQALRSREDAVDGRPHRGRDLGAVPGVLAADAVAQGARDDQRQEADPVEVELRELRGALQRRLRLAVPAPADQLDRHRADRHDDRDHPRVVHRLRDRPPELPGQVARPRRRARDRHVPADLRRRPAVRHVACARPLRHLSGPDHPVPDVRVATGDLHARRVLQRDPVRARGSGAGRRRDAVAGVPQGHRPAGRARHVHGGDPRVHLLLERLPVRHHADLDGPGAGGARRPRVLLGRVAVHAPHRLDR
ncbi:MAG: ABC transporter, permease protein 2 (cluster 1, maltose/g3p/polyamine/iron), partial [uncultured Solirubrobacteraceae bacterium]